MSAIMTFLKDLIGVRDRNSNDKSKNKHKGSSYDSLKPRSKFGTNTPE